MDKPKSSPNLFFGLYFFGAILTATLAVISTWADLEAAFYGFDRRASTPLRTLNCPVLMNRTETGEVSVRISNALDRPLTASVRAEFSTRLESVATLEIYELAPGEARTVRWTISPENIDLRNFIFSKVLVFGVYPTPDKEASCGTFIVNLPIPGTVVLYLLVILGLGGMVGGLLLLKRSEPLTGRPAKAVLPLTFLGAIITVAMGISLVGWWVLAVLLLAVSLITVVVTMNFVFLH